MQVNEVETVAAYLGCLSTHPGEAGALLQDLLISVTNFFRDREAFRALQRQIPDLFRNLSADNSCAFGCQHVPPAKRPIRLPCC